MTPSQTDRNTPMIYIAGDGGKVKVESVVIRFRMEAKSPLGKGVGGELYMLGRGVTDRTDIIDGGEGATEEEEWG